MNLDSIRTGIGTRLATISGLRFHPRIPDALEPPAVFLSLTSITYDDDFDGDSTVLFDLVLCVTGVDAPRGQELLEQYLNNTGSKSIIAAIHGDSDLAGAAHSVRVVAADQLDRTYNVAGSDYIGARFVLEVLAGA